MGGRKCGNFRLPHLLRMAFAVKKDEMFYPLKVSLSIFGADTVMFYANNITNLIKQVRFARLCFLTVYPWLRSLFWYLQAAFLQDCRNVHNFFFFCPAKKIKEQLLTKINILSILFEQSNQKNFGKEKVSTVKQDSWWVRYFMLRWPRILKSRRFLKSITPNVMLFIKTYY